MSKENQIIVLLAICLITVYSEECTVASYRAYLNG